MPRIARGLSDGEIYHVINRGNGRQTVFHKEGDYSSFIDLLEKAVEKQGNMAILAYCLMPNHFHLLLQPDQAGEMGSWMQWLMTCHVRRYHCHYGTSGHVWQGRYKSFIVEKDEHLLTIIRYIEGNPVRAGLVASAKDWVWSSHSERVVTGGKNLIRSLSLSIPVEWTDYVDTALTVEELEKVRRSVTRQAPYGGTKWQEQISKQLGIETTMRPRGRPGREIKK